MANGIPAVEDFNDLDQNAGIAPFPVNIDGRTRVNSAFGYVDPVRDRLMVAGDRSVDRREVARALLSDLYWQRAVNSSARTSREGAGDDDG